MVLDLGFFCIFGRQEMPKFENSDESPMEIVKLAREEAKALFEAQLDKSGTPLISIEYVIGRQVRVVP